MCSATQAEHLWERQSCSVVPGLPGTAPRGRGSRVQGVGCASRGSGTAQWSPLWAGAPCPALRPGVCGFRAGSPGHRDPGPAREGCPGLSLLLTQPPGHQQFVWISTSGSSSLSTFRKVSEHEGERTLLYLRASLQLSCLCRALGCRAQSCTAATALPVLLELLKHLLCLQCVSVSLTASLWLKINPGLY